MVPTLSSAGVLAALRLVREGVVYDLARVRFPGMPLPVMHPQLVVLPYRTPHGLRSEPSSVWPSGEANTVDVTFTSDVVTASMHTGAHIDAAGHVAVGTPASWYGGDELTGLGDFGLLASDGSQLTPMVSRGVLIDVAAYRNEDVLPKGYGITREDLEQTLRSEGVSLSAGDVVLLRTGYGRVWPHRDLIEQHSGSGITLEAAEWLIAQGIAGIGADTEGIEQLPSAVPGNPHPVHTALLRERGMPMIEMLALEQLAEDRRYEFLLIVAPVKIRGASAAMVDPIAIV